jgi:hypothetical protein
MKTRDRFWLSMGTALHVNAPEYFERDDIETSDDFQFKFMKRQWNDNHVLFFDEYDALLEAHDDNRSSFLEVIHAIKNTKEKYALWSSVAIGPFSILHLNLDKKIKSPYNIKDPFKNPNFTLKQVQAIYKEFEDDFKLTIDPKIIEDIYNRTNGYIRLIGSCMKSKSETYFYNLVI